MSWSDGSWRPENDATASTWGEFVAGAARDSTDTILVTLGTGIGGVAQTDPDPQTQALQVGGANKILDQTV